MSDKDRVICY